MASETSASSVPASSAVPVEVGSGVIPEPGGAKSLSVTVPIPIPEWGAEDSSDEEPAPQETEKGPKEVAPTQVPAARSKKGFAIRRPGQDRASSSGSASASTPTSTSVEAGGHFVPNQALRMSGVALRNLMPLPQSQPHFANQPTLVPMPAAQAQAQTQGSFPQGREMGGYAGPMQYQAGYANRPSMPVEAQTILNRSIADILQFTVSFMEGLRFHKAPTFRDAPSDFKEAIRKAHEASLALFDAYSTQLNSRREERHGPARQNQIRNFVNPAASVRPGRKPYHDRRYGAGPAAAATSATSASSSATKEEATTLETDTSPQ